MNTVVLVGEMKIAYGNNHLLTTVHRILSSGIKGWTVVVFFITPHGELPITYQDR